MFRHSWSLPCAAALILTGVLCGVANAQSPPPADPGRGFCGQLLSPGDAAMVPLATSINFSWSSASGASSYGLYFATDPNFNNTIFFDSTSSTNYNITFNTAGTYYWTVTTFSGPNESACYPVRSVIASQGGGNPVLNAGPASITVDLTGNRSGDSTTIVPSEMADAYFMLPQIAGNPDKADTIVKIGHRDWHLELQPEYSMVRLPAGESFEKLRSGARGAFWQGIRNWPHNGLENMTLVLAESGEALEEARSGGALHRHLLDAGDAEFAGPVYRVGDLLVGVGDTINFRLRDRVSEQEGFALLQRYGLVSVQDGPQNHGMWTARVRTDDGMDAIAVVQTMADEAMIAWVQPNFFSLYEKHDVENVPQFTPNDTFFGQQWHLRSVSPASANADMNCEAAWDITRGDPNMRIGVIDDGVDPTHEDLIVQNGLDGVDGSGDGRPEGASDAHGTAVAGVIGAKQNGIGTVGVAHGLRIVPVRLIAGAPLTDAQIRAAFVHCTDQGAAIINNSWGRTYAFNFCSDADDNVNLPLNATVADGFIYALTNGRGGRGSVITFASGNSRANVSGDEQNSHPFLVCVSSSNDQARRSVYSNFGRNIDVAGPSDDSNPTTSCGSFTPGVGCTGGIPCFSAIHQGGTLGITTTDTVVVEGYGPGGYTNSFGGTSSACPAVSGVAALILAANPDLRWQEVKAILEQTAEKIDTSGGQYSAQGHSPFYGFGKVDALAAVNAANSKRTRGIVFHNTGGGTLNVASVTKQNNASWLTITGPTSGPLTRNASFSVLLNINTSGLASGTHTENIVITTDALENPTVSIPVTIAVAGGGTPTPSPTATPIPTVAPTPTQVPGPTPCGDFNGDNMLDPSDVIHAIMGRP